MAVTRQNDYKNLDLMGCLKWTFDIIIFAGYWFPRKNNRSISASLYSVYSIVAVGSTLLTCLSIQLAYIVSIFGQLEEMVNTLYILLTHSTQVTKIAVFVYYRRVIYHLLDNMEDEIFKPKNAMQYKSAMETLNYTNKMAKSLVTLVIAAVFFFALFPLLEQSTVKRLPINGWYPFDVEISPIYEIIFAYQIISLMICGCANAAMDIITAAFICQISIQLDILTDSMLHVREFALLQLKEKNPLEESFSEEDVDSEMQLFLIKCIEHHLKLKGFSENVQLVFSVPLFIQSLVAVGTICMTLFEMSLVSKESRR